VTACSSWERDFEAFQIQVKQGVDPQKLQDWAVPIIQGHNPKYQIPKEDIPIAMVDLPDFLKKLSPSGPEMAVLCKSDTSDKNVIMIAWGGGFGHWGLLVGEPDFVASNDNSKSVVRWVDGIYFFKQTR